MALKANSNDGFNDKVLKILKEESKSADAYQQETERASDNLERGEQAARGVAEHTKKASQSTGEVSDKVKSAVREMQRLKVALSEIDKMAKSVSMAFTKAYGKDWKSGVKSVADLKAKLTALGKNEKAFQFIDEDEANKAIKKIESALEKLSVKEKATTEKSKKANKDQIAGQKELNSQLNKTAKALEKITEVYKKLNQAITSGGFMQVKVSNAGFQSIVTEMSRAIEANKKRGNGNLFLDGVKKQVEASAEEAKEAGNDIGDAVGEIFSAKEVKDKITKSVAKAIKDGIIAGLRLGTTDGLSNIDNVASSNRIAELMAQLDEKGVRRASVNYIADKIFEGEPMDSKQKTSVAKAEAKYKNQAQAKAKVEIKTVEEVEETKRHEQELTHQKEMERLRIERLERERNRVLEANPGEATRIAKALADVSVNDAKLAGIVTKDKAAISKEKVKQEQATTKLMMLEIAQSEENLKKTRDWTSRKEAVLEDWAKTESELEAGLMRNSGRKMSTVDQALQHMDELIAKRHDLEMQARDGVRNTSQQVKNFNDMVKQTRLIAEEQYKVNKGYYEQESALKKALDHYQKMDRYLQAIGNTIAGATRAWNQFGSMIHNIFGRFRNGIMNLFGSGRSQLRQLVSDATDQYSKLERAQIGFTNFFGSEAAKKLTTRIQQEAIAAPALSSGDLAGYVAQLAPVSNGNADLALNATMGLLKAVQYSGSDASTEMSRVVANIRDVMSKGMANTIDIRQFNRAMPAIEKALSEMGASEFLKDGQLSITRENAKTLMEAFARLNTDPSSPVKNIFKQMGNTVEALQEAWKERRTQMVMNVLKDSGAFDMLKGLLSEASNNGLLYKVQDFFTRKIKAIIDWIKSVDWERVGTTLSNGFAKIRDAIRTAVEMVSGALPDMDGWKTLELIFNVIKRAIEGFAFGVKSTIQTVSNMFGGVSPEVIEKAASVVGFMLSPIHKLFSTIGSLATSVLSFAQNSQKTLGQFAQSRIRNYQEKVKAAAELQARVATSGMRSAKDLKNLKGVSYDPDTNLYTRTLNNKKQTGYIYGGTFISESEYNNLKSNGLLNTALKDQIAKDTYNKPLEDLNFVQRQNVNLQYAGGKVSNWWQKTLNTFTMQLGKVVNGGQLLAFGTSVKAMADKTNMAAQVIGGIVQGLGVFNASRGIGSMIGGVFGNAKLGGTVGTIAGIVGGIYTVVNAWYEADKAQKAKDAAEKREKAVNSQVETILNTALETWGLDPEKTEQGKYVANQLTKELNNLAETDMASLIGQGKYGNMEETMKHFQAQAKILANRFDQSNYMEAIDDWMSNDEKEMSDKAKAFHNATGKLYSNWTDKGTAEEQEVRTWIANMVRDLGLLSDSQVGGLLSTATDEKIVETFLQDMDGTINEGQLKMLKEEYAKANELFPTQLEKVKVQLQENTKTEDLLAQNIGALNGNVETIIKEGIKVAENGGTIESGQSLPSDRAVSKSENVGWLSPYGMFGTISKGYGEAKGKLFDDGTLNALKNSKLVEGGDAYDLFTKLLDPAIKNSPAFSGKYRENNLVDMLYQMLNTKTDEANGDTEKLTLIGRAYDRLERDSLIGLPREEMIQKMLEIVRDLYAMSSWLFEAKGGLIQGLMSKPVFRAAGGRGVDTVPAFLQPGEFVMRRGSVMKAGLGVMSALNRGDLAAAARGLGSKLITGGSFNNSKNWSNVTNNNQRTNNNVFKIVNNNMSARTNTYHSLANRIATV